MNSEELKAITRHMYKVCFNEGNLDLLDEYYASDVVCHRPPYPVIKDLQSLKEWIGGFRKGFPDVNYTIDELIVQGENVAAQLTCSGTHTGVLGGDITPTGEKVSVQGCMVWHWVDDKVVEEWEYWDELGFWQQLGYSLVPPQK